MGVAKEEGNVLPSVVVLIVLVVRRLVAER
jgi:hypothetical protein